MSSISDLVCADVVDSHSLADDYLPSSRNLRYCAMEQLLDLGDAIRTKAPLGPIDSPPDAGEDYHREDTLASDAYLRSRPC